MFIYNLLVYILSPIIIIKILYDSLQRGNDSSFIKQRLGLLSFKKNQDTVWLHASSVGETKIALKLLKTFREKNLNDQIVITTTTKSSKAILDKSNENFKHYYLPFDFLLTIGRFIKAINPKICIIIETEIWPNMINICAKRKTPIIIVNARLSKKTLNANMLIKKIYVNTLSLINGIYCKSAREKENYLLLGANQKKVSVLGNIKLCESSNDIGRDRLIERKYVLAASTHPGEERQIITEWLKINDKRTLLVIAPRHPERLGDILSDIPLSLVRVAIRSKKDKIRNNTQIYIADTIGELEDFMQHCEFVFMGGSLVDHGGQNFLEAASLGKSIIVGPYMYNFVDETEEFLKNNSMIMVKNSKSLKHVFERLLKSKQRRDLFGDNARSLLRKKIIVLDDYYSIIKKYI
tara:strand:+ start:1587 stop:2810 length:1224 start_codon:yes stop_codon:yes gene_type:complete